MNPRYLWVGIAVAALLTVASVCLAQETPPPAPAAPPAPATAAPPTPAAPAGTAPGMGSIGGMIGGSAFYASDDYTAGALSRFAFSASFRYIMSPRLRWQVSPGFTWAAYSEDEPRPFPDPDFPNETWKKFYLTLLLPANVQLQVLSRQGHWLYHAGAGPGLYRVWVENHRKVLQDPVTRRVHRGLYPGLTAEVGVARYLRALPSVSVEATATTHYAFAEDKEDFPSGFNTAVGVFELRLGANYHFALNQPKKRAEPHLLQAPPR